jgi:hypothetical protein
LEDADAFISFLADDDNDDEFRFVFSREINNDAFLLLLESPVVVAQKKALLLRDKSTARCDCC